MLHKSITQRTSAKFAGTGKGVRIAIVDDGICVRHPAIKNLNGGAQFLIAHDGTIKVDVHSWASQFADSHGSLCAAVISRRVPDSTIYSLRVLDDQSRGHPLALIAALEWAIENKIHIVNLSLGTTDQNYC